MRPKIQGLFRHLLLATAIIGLVIGWSSPSNAYVQKIVIDQMVTLNVFPIPLGSGSSTPSTTAVPYTVYWGRVFGTLDPSHPRNAVITDINFAAPVNGGYSYIANFEIATPTDPAQRSGLMIHAVSNRGGAAIFTSGVLPAGNAALIAGATYVASGWQGDLLAQCTPVTPVNVPYPACFDLNSGPYGSISATASGTVTITPPKVSNVNGVANLSDFVVQVPVATTDRSPPNGKNTITGSVYSHVCTGNFGCGLAVGSAPTPTSKMQIQVGIPPYMPASLNTSQAQFWSITSQTFTGVDTGVTPITNWTWAYCPGGPPGTPNPNWICLGSGTFDPNLMYEMVYTAANPLVLGVGFAAFSDLASFLRYGTTAPGGGTNPIAGTVTKTIIDGVSQSGGFIRGLIFYGFNADEQGRIVYDGAWPDRDARMFWMNERWVQPEQLMYLYEGGDEAPVWYADYPNLARGLPPNGIFHRCSATSPNTCPQVLETFASAEIMSEKESSSLCGFTCVADIPLPPNDGSRNHVYRYFQAGSTHGGGTASFNWQAPGTVTIPAGQEGPNDVIPETYTDDALFDAFIKLLMNGTPMPPSVACVTYPGLSCPNGWGHLVSNLSQAAVGFPNIPGFPFYGNQAWRPFVYNFGPDVNYNQQTGVPTIAPPAIGPGPGQGVCASGVCPLYVPTVDRNGNDYGGGIPSVLFQAPLATYVGWNLSTIGWYGPNAINGQPGQPFPGAGNSGTYYPLWDTEANRTAAGDPRQSLEERYGTNNGYKCAAQLAAINAVEQRFLLPSDANLLLTGTNGTVSLAAPINTSNVLASGSPGFVPTEADTIRANILCSLEAIAANYPGLNLGLDANYAFIDLGATTLHWNSGPIAGSVLFGQGLNVQLAGGNYGGLSNGAVFYDGTGNVSGSLQITPPVVTVSPSVTSVALTAAQNFSSYAASLPVTQRFGNINNTTTIFGNGGLNVIDVANIRNAQLVLSGTASDVFVINVSGSIQTNQPITLSGVSASHVLFNLTGTSGNILQTSGGNVLYGTYLATNGGQFQFAQLNLTGALINTGGDVHFVGGSQILTFAPFTLQD